jgi:predicted HD superfamily hydrolase involved in NAD metabolism
MDPFFAFYLRGFALTGNVPDDVSALLARHGCLRTLEHSWRVAAEAGRLARFWKENPGRAETAGWLHDISVIVPPEERVDLARRLGIDVLPEERAYPMILHQKLSAAMACEVFSIQDPAVLSAIECHTTLKAGAGRLDKILFVAD